MSKNSDFHDMQFSSDILSFDISFIEQTEPSKETILVNGRHYALKGDPSKIEWFKSKIPECTDPFGTTAEVIKERLFSLGATDVAFSTMGKAYAVGLQALDVLPQRGADTRFRSWLSAFNSGDKTKLEEFTRQFKTPDVDFVERQSQLFDHVQGFNCISIVASSPTKIQVLLREECAFQEYALLTLEVEAEKPHRVLNIGLAPHDVELQPAPKMTEAEAIAAIDAEITRLAEQGKFSGTVLVTKMGNPTPLVSRSVGMANIEHGTENTLDTKFNLGSMSKMCTTVAILQLVEEGKLSIDDPIGKYLKTDINPELAAVTVRQLLTHTGGTGSTEGSEFSKGIGPKDYMRLCKERKPEFTPGSEWKYSNYGFVLLGALIEEVSQKSYYDCIRERVYEKAGMKDSDSYLKTDTVPNMATGYIRKRDGLKDNFDTLPLRGSPAGGGYSTAVDLTQFAQALGENRLLHEDSMALVRTAKPVAPGSFYAAGFQTGDFWYGHAGRMDGVNSELRIYPDTGYVVTVMANLDPPAASDLAEFIGGRMPLVEGVRPTIHLPGAPEKVSIADRMNELGIHGVSVAVCKNGDVAEQGFGDLKEPHTLVQAASISKTITALTILSLAEEKIVSLDEDVSAIIGKELWDSIDPTGICKDMSPKMTIRQLLSHTAGLKEDDERGFQGYSSDTKKLPTIDAILKGDKEAGVNSAPVRLDSKPGTHFAYSGGGTMILQKVIECKTGNFEKAVQKRVFDKLGLKDSCFTLSAERNPVHGDGPEYTPLPGKWMMQPELAAAGLWTTAHDLAKIAVGIQKSLTGEDGGIIGMDFAREMIKPQIDEGPRPGLGLFVEKKEGVTYFYHDGSNIGFRCIMVANDTGDGAVVMTNSDHGNDMIPELIRTIAKDYNWQGRENLEIGFPPVSPEIAEASSSAQVGDVKKWGETYPGRYQFDGYVADLVVLGGKLWLKVHDTSYEVTALTEKAACFREKKPGPWFEVIYHESEEGVPSLTIYGAPHINQKVWAEKFLGVHPFGTISENEGKFYVQLGKDEPFEVWPTADGFRDAVEGPPNKLCRFTRDPEGVIGIL